MAEPISSVLLAGVITRAQGIKGEVRIRPYTDSADEWLSIRQVMLDGEFRRVRNPRVANGQVILQLEGIYDRNAAEMLRGKELYIRREDGPVLEENRWYIADLVGCRMVDEHDREIGTIVDVLQPAGQNLLQVKAKTGVFLMPLLKAVLAEVDVSARQVRVWAERLEEVRCDED